MFYVGQGWLTEDQGKGYLKWGVRCRIGRRESADVLNTNAGMLPRGERKVGVHAVVDRFTSAYIFPFYLHPLFLLLFGSLFVSRILLNPSLPCKKKKRIQPNLLRSRRPFPLPIWHKSLWPKPIRLWPQVRIKVQTSITRTHNCMRR